MSIRLSRRNFLKQTGLAAAGLALSGDDAAAGFVPKGALADQPPDRQVPTVCAMCPARCLLVARVRQGRVVKLDGNPAVPFNDGRLCARGHAAIQLLYDRDRLKYPFKRVGARGEGKWSRISWAEAIDTISLKMEQALRRHGPGSLALFAGGPSAAYPRELFTELGVVNQNDASFEQCRAGRDLAYRLTFGNGPGDPVRLDYQNTRCIVLMGSHLGENVQVPELRQVLAARQRGAGLIVVDPRFSAIAAKADYHLMIRPGTDIALLLGWMNIIIEEGRYDVGHVAAGVEGFAALRRQASRYPVERVAALTGLSAREIARTARVMAAGAPAVAIHPGGRSSRHGNDVQRLRAKAILTGLLGCWGRPGGILPPASLPGTRPAGQGENPAAGEGGDPFQPLAGNAPGAEIIRKGLAGELEVLGCWGQNPFHACPNPYRTMAAFKKAGFVFVCDLLPTETALYADIILPEASFLERYDRVETWTDTRPMAVALRAPVVPARYECRDPYWITRQLGVRLGRGKGFRFETVRERLDHDLARFGLSIEKLAGMGGVATFEPVSQADPAAPVALPTPSGRIEFYSAVLEAKGFAPVPDYEPLASPPAGYLRLLTGKSPVRSNSATVNNRWLRHEEAENSLWLHEEVARGLGVTDGERLFLENQDGIRSLKPVKIKATPGIRPDCVYLAHGFGSRSFLLSSGFDQGVSDSALLTRTGKDPVSGSRAARGNFIRLVRGGKPLDASPPPTVPSMPMTDGHETRF